MAVLAFDGITIRALVKELNPWLNSARIDKIYQPEKDEINIILRHPETGTAKILISANPKWCRLHLTAEKKENPPAPPGFCMLLRKHLEGGKILNIDQYNCDRIIIFTIQALNDFKEWQEKLLICEFMGRHSNILLVNPINNLIIDAMKKYDGEVSSHREVLPGKEYILPPDQGKLNPLKVDFLDFAQFMWNKAVDKTVASSLFSAITGISIFTAQELCRMVGIEPETPVEQCGEFELSKLYNGLKKLIADMDHGLFTPVVAYKNLIPVEYAPYPIQKAPDVTTVDSNSISEAMDRFYSEKLALVKAESIKSNLFRTVKMHQDKLYKKKFHQESDLANAYKNLKFKLWGELLTSYAYSINKGDTEVNVLDYYSGENITIKLDPRYTPMQNAQRYFKKYNKSNKAIKHLESLIAKNQEEIDYLDSLLVALNQADSLLEIREIMEEMKKGGYLKENFKTARKEQIQSTPREFVSEDGFKILVGRNNRQNDYLTFKQAARNDIWLHAQGIPGSHVIIRLPKPLESIDEIPISTLLDAASLAACYSKAQGAEKVPVDYTFRYNVRKPTGARPGKVVYDNYWTVYVNPHSERVQKLLTQLQSSVH
ncbi:MAG: Rqc2 family fibronectin-binding protein [Syntrophomonadaceae bacterium]